jgi:O-succinylbenzoate synthase
VAGAAIEMALLDAELKSIGISLGQWLEVGVPGITYGAVIGIPQDHSVGSVLEAAATEVEAGASRLRVKIDPTWAVEPLEALRREFPEIPLQADANASMTGQRGLDLLVSIDALGLSCIEEPIPGRDLTAVAALTQELATPVCLDESIKAPDSVRAALRYRACSTFCLKPGRLGGVRSTLRALEMAEEAGARAFVGGMFETGLGRAVLGSLAGLKGANLISDIAAPSTYLEVDPCGLAAPQGGLQSLFGDPGVGPWPERSVLEQL